MTGSLKECFGLWKLTKDEMKVFDEMKCSWDESDKEFKGQGMQKIVVQS